MVIETYDGSLKAEHGTGRNMAPFVEMEWGREARGLMKEIKQAFDPDGLLNPGVILNDDPQIHIRNLKPLPAADPLIDKCIECGFCEFSCPSKDLTLTPRQRIVVWRELTRLAAGHEDDSRRARIERLYSYQGDKTCATDGLCALACPVEIDTGKLIKHLRVEDTPRWPAGWPIWPRPHGHGHGRHPGTLKLLDLAHRLMGSQGMKQAASLARTISLRRLPLWNEAMPCAAERGGRPRPPGRCTPEGRYFPSCISRSLGLSRVNPYKIIRFRGLRRCCARRVTRSFTPRASTGSAAEWPSPARDSPPRATASSGNLRSPCSQPPKEGDTRSASTRAPACCVGRKQRRLLFA